MSDIRDTVVEAMARQAVTAARATGVNADLYLRFDPLPGEQDHHWYAAIACGDDGEKPLFEATGPTMFMVIWCVLRDMGFDMPGAE